MQQILRLVGFCGNAIIEIERIEEDKLKDIRIQVFWSTPTMDNKNIWRLEISQLQIQIKISIYLVEKL